MSDRVKLMTLSPDGRVSSRSSESRSAFWLGLATKAASLVRRITMTEAESWPMQHEGSHAGETVNEETLLSLSAAWACVNLIAGLTGTLPFHVWKNDANGVPQIASDFWLERILQDPNIDQTCVDMLEWLAGSLELRGNGFYEKRRQGGRIIALEPMPATTAVKRNARGRLEYRFPGDDGRTRVLDQDDVWHVRGFGGGPLGGLSTLSFGRHAFGLAIATDRAAGSTFANGVRPSGVLKFKDWLKGEKRQAAHEKLTREHVSAMNTGKPLVLEGGVEWQQISFSPEDSQMLQSRGFSVEDVCRFFGVPPVLVGHTEKTSSWGTGVAEITLGFVKFNLRRRLKRIEKSADKQLLTAQERAAGYYTRFDLEGLLRGSPLERARFYEIMTRIGTYEVDYVRRLENLPPLPNGAGSVPRMQAQNVPLTSLQVAVPAETPTDEE